jgi:hypothetical protein
MDNVHKIDQVVTGSDFYKQIGLWKNKIDGNYFRDRYQVIVDTSDECAGVDLYLDYGKPTAKLICAYNVIQDSLTEEELLFSRMTKEIPYVRSGEFIKILEDL